MSIQSLSTDAVSGEWLSPSQVARTAGVSVALVQRWLRSGVLPSARTPLGRLVRATDLGALIAERERRREGRR